jgi:hypothetical protein
MRKLLLIIPAVGLITSGCASAQATSKPADRPALMVPPPPPRVIEPAPEPPPEPVSELPVSPSVTPPPRPGRAASREASPKPEPPKAAEAKAGDPPPEPPPAPVPPVAQLRTPQTADTSGAAKNVRATIDSAHAMLNTVNYGPLSNERKKAYNDVKLFIQQAEDALKQGNLVFAQGVATKAETLARELAGK